MLTGWSHMPVARPHMCSADISLVIAVALYRQHLIFCAIFESGNISVSNYASAPVVALSVQIRLIVLRTFPLEERHYSLLLSGIAIGIFLVKC